jgi:pyruvate ferredoxin oxidoreductase gamma subunit
LGLDSTAIDRNLKLALASFESIPPVRLEPSSREADVNSVRLVIPSYQGGWRGTASIASHSNTSMRKTGDWRVSRPVIDSDKCTRCWICFVNCPDGAIWLTPEDVPQVDYTVCKGCMICLEGCPIDAVQSVREVEVR